MTMKSVEYRDTERVKQCTKTLFRCSDPKPCMKTIGYMRVSTDQQDLKKQKHLLLEYAQQNHLVIEQFIEAEVSSRKTQRERRITELVTVLEPGDQVLVAELSRLGRNMLETLNLITGLSERGIHITFIRQSELSTSGSHGK